MGRKWRPRSVPMHMILACQKVHHIMIPTSHPKSVTGFASFDLHATVQHGIAAAGFVDPRPIQVQTIPAALKGRDILGLAQTGTGKTAAFALPVLERLRATRKPGPRVLIVAPTRELASQISDDIRTLAKFTHLKTVTIFGGVSSRSQMTELRANPEIIVACPGRLLDLFQQGAVTLKRIETLVLDEADHMFAGSPTNSCRTRMWST
jgi:ATP-dependent RNA helicase RhlE